MVHARKSYKQDTETNSNLAKAACFCYGTFVTYSVVEDSHNLLAAGASQVVVESRIGTCSAVRHRSSQKAYFAVEHQRSQTASVARLEVAFVEP